MIIRSFDDSDGGGFDPRNYAPIGVTAYSISRALGASYTTDMSVTGEGFLKKVIYTPETNNKFLFSLRITIDGVVVVNIIDITFDGSVAGTKYFCTGINVLESNLFNGSNAPINLASAVDLSSIPYTGQLIVFPNPLFFKSSCLIETRAQLASGGSTTYGIFGKSIIGGLLI